MTKKQVIALYREWRKENNNQKPNRVIVRIHWEDDDNAPKGYQIDTIALIPFSQIVCTEDTPVDTLILYYISTLDELFSLMEPGNGSDFIVDEVLEFYKM